MAALQHAVKEADSNAFTALLQVRMRYRQTKNLLADVLDAIDEYIGHTVSFSKRRVQLMERVQVALVGCAGSDEAMALATTWSRAEDAAVVTAMTELCERFDAAAAAILEVNDAVDARLLWIDMLAGALVKEKSKWKVCGVLSCHWSFAHCKTQRDIQKAQSGSSSSVGRLAGTNDDMITALSRLEAGIGTFAEELDVWVTQCKDLLTPCLTELMRSLRVSSREELSHMTKEVVRRLLAMQNEVEGTRSQVLAKRGPGGRFDWPKLRSMIASPVQRLYYFGYLQQAHNLENLLFVEDVKQFRERAVALEPNSSKLLALARPIVDKYVVTNAPSQVNIVGSVREQVIADLKSNATVALFDEAFEHVFKMMDRDSSIHFKLSAVGQEMVRRLSHCRLPDEPSRILHPVPDVELTVEPLLDAGAEAAPPPTIGGGEVLSSSGSTTGSGSKRRLGSFSLMSKKSDTDLRSDSKTDGGGGSSGSGSPIRNEKKRGSRTSRDAPRSPKFPSLLSPRRTSQSSVAPKAAAAASSPKEGESPRLTPLSPKPVLGESLEDALARSPRRDGSPVSASPQSLRRDRDRERAKLVEEEMPVSPREWLRSSNDAEVSTSSSSPTPPPAQGSAAASGGGRGSGGGGGSSAGAKPKRKPGEKMSPRSKLVSLRAAGTSNKNKQRIPQAGETPDKTV